MYSPRQKIIWFAAVTRLFVIILQVIFNLFIPDHDAHVFTSPHDPDLQFTYLDRIVDTLLGGLKRWDAQYFIHIAQYGYTYENCLAFFPLFPLTVRYFAYFLSQVLGGCLNFHSLLLLSGTCLNIFYFIKATDTLYKLSIKVLKSESLAYKAAILYCVNPGSIFFTTFYSESLFSWLTFYGMLRCISQETLRFTNIDIVSSIPISLSIITRSNGLLNLGFILYASLKNITEKTLPEIFYRYHSIKYKILIPLLTLPLIASLMALALTLAISALPFILIQTYNYYKFCVHHEHNLPEYLTEGEWVLPGQGKGEWCNRTFPIAYLYVQNHYWDVGLFHYYQWKQIPNFLLALPILLIMIFNCYKFIDQNSKHCFKLGINVARFQRTTSYDSASIRKKKSKSSTFVFYEPDMFVYVVHGVFLTIFCIFFVHIQIATRLIASASPLLYWFIAIRIKSQPSKMTEQNHINEHFRKIGTSGKLSSEYFSITNLEGVYNMHSKWKTFILSKVITDKGFKLVKLYFLGYFIIGTILFCNFYPWT